TLMTRDRSDEGRDRRYHGPQPEVRQGDVLLLTIHGDNGEPVSRIGRSDHGPLAAPRLHPTVRGHRGERHHLLPTVRARVPERALALDWANLDLSLCAAPPPPSLAPAPPARPRRGAPRTPPG